MVFAIHTLMRPARATLATVFAVAAGWMAAPAQPARTDPAVDGFGYLLLGPDDPGCVYSFVDLGATGTPVSFTAASAAASAADDGGAAIVLAPGFELYGQPVTGLVLSTNGYLAVATDLSRDDGGDYSNDAVLPAVPGEEDPGTAGDEPRAGPRLMVYHDDLSAAASGGTAYYQHFTSCPRPGESGLVEACTVVQWADWGFANTADVFTFEALLYHTSLEIVFQVGSGDTSAGASATVGIQDARSTVAVQHRGPVAAETALCFFEPRFPVTGPAADLAIEMSDGQDAAEPGATIEYVLEVRHLEGPSPVAGAQVDDDFPEELTDCTWTCTATAGASCTAAGSDDLTDTIHLVEDSAVTYVATCQVALDAAGTLVNAATVSLPAGFTDFNPGDNFASDSNSVADTLIFSDGFESGGIDAW